MAVSPLVSSRPHHLNHQNLPPLLAVVVVFIFVVDDVIKWVKQRHPFFDGAIWHVGQIFRIYLLRLNGQVLP